MQEQFSIFATVGNATQPFDRFVRMVDDVAGRTGLSTLIQIGRSAWRPKNARAVAFVGRPEFERLVMEADHVITHAGVGSVMTAIALGKPPIVVVRRSALGEVIDDHQQDLAAELSQSGLVRVAESADEVIQHVRSGPPRLASAAHASNIRMLEIVERFLS